jgi:HNH endonuclease
MSNESAIRKFSKEEMIAAIQACAAKLGHAPTIEEMQEATGFGEKMFRRQFGNYTKALRASGFHGRGGGFVLSTEELFRDWAGIVREIGAVPSIAEYTQRSKHSLMPMRGRFGRWKEVPAALLRYAKSNGLAEEWADVLEIAKRERRRSGGEGQRSTAWTGPKILSDRPVYGAAMLPQAMCFAPVNEMGVVFLFGALAGKLGFIVTYVGTRYPDIEAFREVAPGRWQRVRIEAEFRSRNFLEHDHDLHGCDLLVCWENNWPEAPMEVIALKEHVGMMGKIG